MTITRANDSDREKSFSRTKHRHPLTTQFAMFSQKTSQWSGHPATFLLAVMVVAVWIVAGPVFGYSDTWQLVINTGTTIVTFLMVFLIQNTQNRDMMSMQLKLSELVLAMKGAENNFASLENLSDEELHELHEECLARADITHDHLERRHANRGCQSATHASKTQHIRTQELKRKDGSKTRKAA